MDKDEAEVIDDGGEKEEKKKEEVKKKYELFEGPRLLNSELQILAAASRSE